MHTVLDPYILHPIPCGARYKPLFPLPGSYDTYFMLWDFVLNLLMPSYFACALYRHQAVLLPDSPWSLPPTAQALVIAAFSSAALIMPFLWHIGLEPTGSIERYREILSIAFPPSFLDRADCYDIESQKPFIVVGSLIFTLIAIMTTTLVATTLASLRVASTMSETMRAHHRTMTKVLIVQALVPAFSIGTPTFVGFMLLSTLMNFDGQQINPHCLVVFSTHALLESLVLIATTPMYRQQLRQWIPCLAKTTKISVGSIVSSDISDSRRSIPAIVVNDGAGNQ